MKTNVAKTDVVLPRRTTIKIARLLKKNETSTATLCPRKWMPIKMGLLTKDKEKMDKMKAEKRIMMVTRRTIKLHFNQNHL